MTHDLSGLFVVSVEQAVAAPYCSGRLADAGARVVKVERPEGDFARRYDAYVNGESAYFVWLNRGKESVALDLKGEPRRDGGAGRRVHPEPRAGSSAISGRPSTWAQSMRHSVSFWIENNTALPSWQT